MELFVVIWIVLEAQGSWLLIQISQLSPPSIFPVGGRHRVRAKERGVQVPWGKGEPLPLDSLPTHPWEPLTHQQEQNPS